MKDLGSTRWRLAIRTTPDFASSALELISRYSEHLILRAVRELSLGKTNIPSQQTAIAKLFGLTENRHAFDSPTHSWAWFREPQITAGLAHFLQEGPSHVRVERVRQFLGAAYEATGMTALLRDLTQARLVNAEAVAEEKRVDLIVQAQSEAGDVFGVVIEAKFGHHLTARQLPAARRHASSRGLTSGNTAFLVVLPHRAKTGTRVFSRPANSGWRAVEWWNLLLLFEKRTSTASDSEAFRSLRHTIWQQTYGM